ncbi:MAG: hypothetical protein ACYC0H_21255, partial [Solirubrobacteraceae bacterium]
MIDETLEGGVEAVNDKLTEASRLLDGLIDGLKGYSTPLHQSARDSGLRRGARQPADGRATLPEGRLMWVYDDGGRAAAGF